MNQREIYSSRILNAPLAKVYAAFENPELLKLWWGPEGFTNTIHEFNLKPGGNWRLTMHGPEQGHYENAAVFTAVIPHQKVAWQRSTPPLFAMEVAFLALEAHQTQISFNMIFDSVEACEKIRTFVEPKNEENFNRLERVLMDD